MKIVSDLWFYYLLVASYAEKKYKFCKKIIYTKKKRNKWQKERRKKKMMEKCPHSFLVYQKVKNVYWNCSRHIYIFYFWISHHFILHFPLRWFINFSRFVLLLLFFSYKLTIDTKERKKINGNKLKPNARHTEINKNIRSTKG